MNSTKVKDLSPTVVMNVESKESSVNFSSVQVFPTLLSPISSNLSNMSYSFSIMSSDRGVRS